VASGDVPAKGDLVWLHFDPLSGHEQAGHRPALILSPQDYNRTVGLALLCPITSRAKGYPFEVELPPGLDVTGVVLADQVKRLDWQARAARKVDEAPREVLAEVLRKIATLLEG